MKEAIIELTHHCPQHCIHCSSRYNWKEEIMLSVGEVKGILDDLNYLRAEEICFSGGEPFTYPHLEEVLEYANKKTDSKITLYTSGFREENIDTVPLDKKYLKKAMELGVEKIVFSVLGVTNKIRLGNKKFAELPYSLHTFLSSEDSLYQFINSDKFVPHGKDNYEDNFLQLKEIIKKSVDLGIETGVNFVVMKQNLHDMEPAARVFERLEIDEMSFLRYVPQSSHPIPIRSLFTRNDYYTSLDPDKKDAELIEDILLRLYRENEDRKMKIRIGDPWRSPRVRRELNLPLRCKAAVDVLEITYRGDVIPCPSLKGLDEYKLGNIREKPLREIIKSGKKVREKMNKIKESGEPCRGQTIQKFNLAC